MNITPNDIVSMVSGMVAQVQAELPSRAFAAANELRNAELIVLRGTRSGKVYRIRAGGKATYTASAPGEPPAVRTGALRASFRPVITEGKNPAIESAAPYASYMEDGTPGGMIAPRPFRQKILDMAKPKIEAIYAQPYNLGP